MYKGYGMVILRIHIRAQEQVAVHMCCFNGVQRGNYFGGESIRRAEVEVSGVLDLEPVQYIL